MPLWLLNLVCYIVGPMLAILVVALVLTVFMDMP